MVIFKLIRQALAAVFKYLQWADSKPQNSYDMAQKHTDGTSEETVIHKFYNIRELSDRVIDLKKVAYYGVSFYLVPLHPALYFL